MWGPHVILPTSQLYPSPTSPAPHPTKCLTTRTTATATLAGCGPGPGCGHEAVHLCAHGCAAGRRVRQPPASGLCHLARSRGHHRGLPRLHRSRSSASVWLHHELRRLGACLLEIPAAVPAIDALSLPPELCASSSSWSHPSSVPHASPGTARAPCLPVSPLPMSGDATPSSA